MSASFLALTNLASSRKKTSKAAAVAWLHSRPYFDRMLRKGLLILGGALALLSVIGLAVDRSATLLWFVVMAAMVSIGSAFIVEDEHALGISRGAAPAVIGLGLMAVFVAGLSSHQPAWSVWLTFVLGLAALALSLVVVADRHVDLRLPRHG